MGDATKPSLTTEYGDDGRVVSQTDGKGAQTTWTWEPAGIHGKSTMTDPTGGAWINEYERNWLVKQVDPTGAVVGTQSSKYRTAYPFGSPYTGWKGN